MNAMNAMDWLKLLQGRDVDRGMLIAAARGLRDAVVDRTPDVTIGGESDPYLRRWWLVPRKKYGFNIYLHQFMRSDRDTLHDHPWDNVSFLFEGEYMEVVPRFEQEPTGERITLHRKTGDIVARPATACHQVKLFQNIHGRERPTWSLFLTGPVLREWGFHCESGWIPWQTFTGQREVDGKPVTAYNDVRGCGEHDG